MFLVFKIVETNLPRKLLCLSLYLNVYCKIIKWATNVYTCFIWLNLKTIFTAGVVYKPTLCKPFIFETVFFLLLFASNLLVLWTIRGPMRLWRCAFRGYRKCSFVLNQVDQFWGSSINYSLTTKGSNLSQVPGWTPIESWKITLKILWEEPVTKQDRFCFQRIFTFGILRPTTYFHIILIYQILNYANSIKGFNYQPNISGTY